MKTLNKLATWLTTNDIVNIKLDDTNEGDLSWLRATGVKEVTIETPEVLKLEADEETSVVNLPHKLNLVDDLDVAGYDLEGNTLVVNLVGLSSLGLDSSMLA